LIFIWILLNLIRDLSLQELRLLDLNLLDWSWFFALSCTMSICAELLWEVPVVLCLVNLFDLGHFRLSKNNFRSNPNNTSYIGPAIHVWAISEKKVSLSCFENVPSFIVSATLVNIRDRNWFSLGNISGKSPGLAKVLGVSFGEKIITILIVNTRGRQWFLVISKAFFAEVVVITCETFVNVLTWIAVPQGIFAILLPPFTMQAFQIGFWIGFREWTSCIS